MLPLISALLIGAASAGCESDTCGADCAADTDRGGDADVAPDTILPEDTATPDTAPPEDTAAPDTTPPEDTTSTQDATPEVVAPAGTEVTSSKNAYRVWFDGPKTIKVGVEASYVVTVHDMSDAPVTGLDLAPSFIHASMGHGGPKNPSAVEEGDGVYTVTSVVASMSGNWDLDVRLPDADKARFVVSVTN